MDLYTRQEAAKYLKVTESTIKYYINKELIPAFKKGNLWLILESDLKSFENSDWYINRKAGPKTKYSEDNPRHKKFIDNRRYCRNNRARKRLEASASDALPSSNIQIGEDDIN